MPTIRQMTYQPRAPGTAAVETLTFDRLRALNDAGTQRADFHVLAVVSGGRGRVEVDFEDHTVAERTIVWIPPGAVHRWAEIAGVTGHLALFVPVAPVTTATRALVAMTDRAASWTVADRDWRYVEAARDHLALETAEADGDTRTELPQILLSALLARLQPPKDDAERRASPAYRDFRAVLEAHFREHHDAGFYARTLGYAPRTLSRAVQAATGRTAKAVIVDRLVLEAKRLLAHDRLSAAQCATALGFSDASSFSVFFANATGSRPGAWQRATITAT